MQVNIYQRISLQIILIDTSTCLQNKMVLRQENTSLWIAHFISSVARRTNYLKMPEQSPWQTFHNSLAQNISNKWHWWFLNISLWNNNVHSVIHIREQILIGTWTWAEHAYITDNIFFRLNKVPITTCHVNSTPIISNGLQKHTPTFFKWIIVSTSRT